MILRNNIASTPVKNDSLFFLGCLFLFLAAIVFTAFNLKSLSSGYLDSSRLQSKIAQEQSKRAELRKQSDNLRAKIIAIKTPEFVNESQFFDNAIKRRTFSWTTLFDQFERALPPNVKMVSIIPSIRDTDININMEVAGRSLNDVIALVKALQASPVFDDVVFRDERQAPDGLHFNIALRYLPANIHEIKASEPAPTAPPEEAQQQTSDEEEDQ
jgi:Tfp pilus assembly protein PilN